MSGHTFRAGVSPVGAYHLTGNASEFVRTRREPSILDVRAFATLVQPPPAISDEWYVVKGGSFRHKLQECDSLTWELVPANFARDDIGFRCVKDP